MNELLKKKFIEHLNDTINDRDYTDIDVFCEDEEATEEEIEQLLQLRVKVVEDE